MKGLSALELDGSPAARERRMSDPVRLRQPARRPQLGAPVRRLRRAAPGVDAGGGLRGLPHRSLVPARDRSEIVELEAELACWDLASVPKLAAAPREVLRPHRRPHRQPPRLPGGGSRRRPRRRDGVAPRLQAGRHLRRRVPGDHPLPLLDLRRGGRERAGRPPQGGDPRLRPQPHRPGDRVRLLLRARRLRPARAGLRDGDGQLQPGDRLDRLRHLRPPLLRAAHPGARAGGPATARSRRG